MTWAPYETDQIIRLASSHPSKKSELKSYENFLCLFCFSSYLYLKPMLFVVTGSASSYIGSREQPWDA